MNKTVRVFVASTAEDLEVYRAAVRQVIDRLGHKAVGMESFGAMPFWSLDACRHLVGESDALVVVVGHRYGWVPSAQEGGDGRKSITWHEVDAAREAGLPVFAFLVDEQARWSELREQDRLVAQTTDDEAVAIRDAVQRLREFKAELAQRPFDTFETPADLATKVSTSLSRWLTGASEPHVSDGWWVHPQVGLRVPAPAGWRAMEVLNSPTLMAPESGAFRDNFNVQLLPLPGTEDVEAILAFNVQQLQQLPDVEVERAEVRMVDGREVALAVYHGRMPGQSTELSFACAIAVKSQRQIVVTASVAAERWSEREPLVMDVLSRMSFRLWPVDSANGEPADTAADR